MNTARPMIDPLESRQLMSATLTSVSADPDEGGEAPVALYVSAAPTTSADPDEGGEADPDEGGEVAARGKRIHQPITITKFYDKASA